MTNFGCTFWDKYLTLGGKWYVNFKKMRLRTIARTGLARKVPGAWQSLLPRTLLLFYGHLSLISVISPVITRKSKFPSVEFKILTLRLFWHLYEDNPTCQCHKKCTRSRPSFPAVNLLVLGSSAPLISKVDVLNTTLISWSLKNNYNKTGPTKSSWLEKNLVKK